MQSFSVKVAEITSRRWSFTYTPPPFPWEQWIVTGVVEAPGGPEVWLRNRVSGDALRLAVGERLAEAVFAAAEGDAAVFTLGVDRFLVAVGRSLEERVLIR